MIDYFSITDFIKNSTLYFFLKGRKYQVVDASGVVVQDHSGGSKVLTPLKLSHGKVCYGTLYVDDKSIQVELIEKELESYLEQKCQMAWTAQSQILTNELISNLKSSENSNFETKDLLVNLIEGVRSHIRCEKVLFFTVQNGRNLQATIGMGKEGKIRRQEFDKTVWNKAAETAACSRKIYFINDLEKDPHYEFFDFDDGSKTNNLAAFPIMHSGNVIGVFLTVNKAEGIYNEYDLEIIHRFEQLSGHIIEESLYNQQLSRAEKISSELSKYMSKSMAENLKEKGAGQAGGQQKKVVVLFLKINNFQKFATKLKPTQLINLLNFIYEEVHQVANIYDGTLDKIMTPVMMFLWNHPFAQDEPEDLALQCALEVQKKIHTLSSIISAQFGIKDFSVCIGINSGEAVAGNIGCDEFFDNTVIGDTINTAQRLQASGTGPEIIISDGTFTKSSCAKMQLFKNVSIKAKGKSLELSAYKLHARIEKDVA
ncbi:MAG: hypothetical protein HOE90_06750 [Bacteriovoracaceae bacterium]|jgi:class 3 adenylate cyclase|nr:hypothetical protein [Bacteriovoracaceae bacterium]